jgi:hypothetical protein
MHSVTLKCPLAYYRSSESWSMTHVGLRQHGLGGQGQLAQAHRLRRSDCRKKCGVRAPLSSGRKASRLPVSPTIIRNAAMARPA